MKSIVLVLATAGCAGSAGEVMTTPTARRPGPAGFADADFVVLGATAVTTYRLHDSKVEQLGTVELGKANTEPMAGDWPDHDHLFVKTSATTVVEISDAGVTDITMPSALDLTTPKPPNADAGHLDQGSLVVMTNEVWWSTCPWLDTQGTCETYVNARLWPSRDVRKTDHPPLARNWEWPRLTPTDYNSNEVSGEIICDSPNGTHKTLATAQSGEKILDSHWISPVPPQLLVRIGNATEQEVRWVLFDSCASNPVATGTAAAPGPNGLWAADTTIRRNGIVVGAVTAGNVRFRPTAR